MYDWRAANLVAPVRSRIAPPQLAWLMIAMCMLDAGCAASKAPDAYTISKVEALTNAGDVRAAVGERKAPVAFDAVTLNDVQVLLSTAESVSARRWHRRDHWAGTPRYASIGFSNGETAILTLEPDGSGELAFGDDRTLYLLAICPLKPFRIEEGTNGHLGDGYRAGAFYVTSSEAALAPWRDDDPDRDIIKLRLGGSFAAGRCHYTVMQLVDRGDTGTSFIELQSTVPREGAGSGGSP